MSKLRSWHLAERAYIYRECMPDDAMLCRIGLKSQPYPITIASPSALTFLPEKREKKKNPFCQQKGGMQK